MGHRNPILVATGNGKGKTTAALGTALRATGWGKRVLVIEFIKGKWETGERRIAANAALPIDFLSTGKSAAWLGETPPEVNLECAREGLKLLQENINTGKYQLIILDEVNIVLNQGWIKTGELIPLLAARPDNVSVFLTGRDAPQQIIDFADQVSVINDCKHPFQLGHKAVKGIDF